MNAQAAYFWTAHAIAAAWLLSAVGWEVRTTRIPNAIPGAGLAIGLALVTYDHAVAAHLLGLVLGVAVGVVAYRNGALGGGGFKCFFALTWLIGLRGSLFLVPALAAAAIIGIAMVRARRSPNEVPFTPMLMAALLVSYWLESRGAFLAWAPTI